MFCRSGMKARVPRRMTINHIRRPTSESDHLRSERSAVRHGRSAEGRKLDFTGRVDPIGMT